MRIFIYFLFTMFVSNQLFAQEMLYEKRLADNKIVIQVKKERQNYNFYYKGFLPMAVIVPTELNVSYFNAFREALASIPDNTDFNVILESGGGYIFNIIQTAILLESKCPGEEGRYNYLLSKKNCEITTYVGEKRMCASACISFFMLGHRRIAHETAEFGFHSMSYQEEIKEPQPELAQKIKGDEEIQECDLKEQKKETVQYRRVLLPPQRAVDFYDSYLIDSDFLNRLKEEGVFSTQELTIYHPDDLHGSNMVHETIYYQF